LVWSSMASKGGRWRRPAIISPRDFAASEGRGFADAEPVARRLKITGRDPSWSLPSRRNVDEKPSTAWSARPGTPVRPSHRGDRPWRPADSHSRRVERCSDPVEHNPRELPTNARFAVSSRHEWVRPAEARGPSKLLKHDPRGRSRCPTGRMIPLGSARIGLILAKAIKRAWAARLYRRCQTRAKIKRSG
jgi:hypothetical protein